MDFCFQKKKSLFTLFTFYEKKIIKNPGRGFTPVGSVWLPVFPVRAVPWPCDSDLWDFQVGTLLHNYFTGFQLRNHTPIVLYLNNTDQVGTTSVSFSFFKKNIWLLTEKYDCQMEILLWIKLPSTVFHISLTKCMTATLPFLNILWTIYAWYYECAMHSPFK